MAGPGVGPLGSLIGAVRAWPQEPFTLRVYLADGTDRVVAVPTKRNKWKHLTATMDSLRWTVVEGMNRDGVMVGRYEHPEQAATELEELEGTSQVMTTQLAGLMRIALNAQDVAVKRMGDHQVRVLDVAVKLVEVMANQLAQSQQENIELRDLAAKLNQGEDEGTEALVEALPAILKLAAAKQVPPNGTS